MAEVITLQQSDINFSYSEFLPDVVRVLEAGYEISGQCQVVYVANVYGNAFLATLTWTSACHDERLNKGALARVYWPNKLTEVDGCYPVIRLVPIDGVNHTVNLFDTVPPSWSRDFGFINRAGELWNQLPETLRALFNEIFWDAQRFQRYICMPASLNKHHNGWGGNLRHAVEMAEHAERIALDVEGVSADLIILAGLLYNAPLCGAFQWQNGQWRLGSIASIQNAKEQFRVLFDVILDRQPRLLSDQERQTLRGILFSRQGKNEATSHNSMLSLEMEILRMADRLCCVLNMRRQDGAQ